MKILINDLRDGYLKTEFIEEKRISLNKTIDNENSQNFIVSLSINNEIITSFHCNSDEFVKLQNYFNDAILSDGLLEINIELNCNGNMILKSLNLKKD